jgi:hypothetical protein
MIANFFQSLDTHGVAYLLISGQASVLYGAATFSEDIDLWINPTAVNRDKFLSAVRVCGARYYKLTPEFKVEHLTRGHGFHFVLPTLGRDEVFLDVMGAPPRVGSFASAVNAARWIETEWGKLHTIGIKDLVALKKTQRLEDYAVISKLVLAWFDQSECAGGPEDFTWAIENIFALTELRNLIEDHPAAFKSPLPTASLVVEEFARQLLTTGDVAETAEKEVSEWMQQRMIELQQGDRRYWRNIVAELKKLRATGKLMAEGAEI